MKFYRLVLMIAFALVIAAAVSHGIAGRQWLVSGDLGMAATIVFAWAVLRYPKRAIYRLATLLTAAASVTLPVAAFHAAAAPPSIAWSIAGALSSAALLGSVTLSMTLGHWYLVVRGMSIDPLKRVTIATVLSMIGKLIVVFVSLVSLRGPGSLDWGGALHRLMIIEGIFFWMRVGWGLVAPLLLFPMVWGTVKIRSTMAATGILYVVVVAVVIGEVLGTYLSASLHLPL